jgi:hypothetical protein
MKKNNIYFLVALVLVSFLYIFSRLYHLNDLIGFRLDQGIHLLETKTMVDERKIRLVGPMVTSKTFMGRNFFIGANYYYVLGIVGLIGKWNPMNITIIFIFLELIFYLFFVFFLKRKFNSVWALLTLLAVAISPYLITHSRFFWNPHLLIPLSVLLLLTFEKYFLNKRLKYLFLAASCWGFAFACHYSAVFWGIFFVVVLIKLKTFKVFKNYLIILLGFVLGNLPWFLFEIRHGFYNTKTLFDVFTKSTTGGEMTSHYFIFPLLIFTIFGLLQLIKKIKSKNIANILLIIVVLESYLVQKNIFRDYVPLDVIEGWNYSEQQKVIDLITENGCPNNFEIAATVQGDTRAYDLRFLLNKVECEPMSVDEYPEAKTLFLVAPTDRPPETETVWEVTCLKDFKVKREENLNKKIKFYELERL